MNSLLEWSKAPLKNRETTHKPYAWVIGFLNADLYHCKLLHNKWWCSGEMRKIKAGGKWKKRDDKENKNKDLFRQRLIQNPLTKEEMHYPSAQVCRVCY